MKKKTKRVLIISVGSFLLLFFLASVFSIWFFFRKSNIKGVLEDYLSKKTGFNIVIGKFDYQFFPLFIGVNSLDISSKTEEAEIELFFGSINLNGDIIRLIKKEKPFLDSLKISDVVCRITTRKAEEKQKKKIDFQSQLSEISNLLDFIKNIKIEDSSLSYDSPSQYISLQDSDLVLSHSCEERGFDYAMASEKFSFKNPGQKISFNSGFKSSGKFSLREIPFIESEFSIAPLKVEMEEKHLVLDGLNIKCRGEFQNGRKALFFPSFRIEVSPFFDANGSLKVDLSEGFTLFSNPEIHLKDFSKIYDLLKPYIFQNLKGVRLDITGAAFFKGEIQYEKDSSAQRTNVNGLIRLDPASVSYSSPNFSISNVISGKFDVKGSFSSPELSGFLKINNGTFMRDDIKIHNFSLDIPLSFNKTASILDISLCRGDIKKLVFSLEDKRIELDNVGFKARAGFNLSKKEIDFDCQEFQLSSLSPLQIKAKASLDPGGEKYFNLKSSNIDFQSLFDLFSPIFPEKLIEWEPAGNFNLEIEAGNSSPEKRDWTISARLNLAEVIFHNPEFTIAGEALDPAFVLDGTCSPDFKKIGFSLKFGLSRGESLWNEYYLNWKDSPFNGKISGVYHVPLNELNDLSIESSFLSLGKINASGQLRLQQPFYMDFQVSVLPLSLGSLYSFLPAGQDSDESGLALVGEAESRFRIRKQMDRITLSGQCSIKNASVESKQSGMSITGIEAKIPFFYDGGTKKSGDKTTTFFDKGYIHVSEFKSPYFSMKPLRINLYAANNLFMIEPLSMDIFSGNASVGKSVFSLGSNPSNFSVVSSFALNDLDLSQAPLESSQFKLKGFANVDLQRIGISPDLLFTTGQAEIDIFDSKIGVRNIEIEKPFSKNRTISCDVDFSGLNLEKMTDCIPFGRVTGVLNGEIKGLAFSYGQPESFVMRLESVKRKGIPQKFSTKAVDDLSVISSGEGSSFSSNKGINRFITEFRYEKIGIYCSLKNDMFTLRGTIKEKGTEYLVKNSWLFGISVINRKPKSRISFKDMLNRLKRIGRTEESR